AGRGRNIAIWSVGDGHLIRSFSCPGRADELMVIPLAFAPNGKVLAVSGTDMTIHFFDVQTGTEVSPFEGHTLPIRAGSFSPDARTLASAGDDGAIWLWDSKTGEPLRVLASHARPSPKPFVDQFAAGSWRQIVYLDKN